METVFLATKLHIPPWRNEGVFRSRLLDIMQKGYEEEKKLTLISAPAGYGKTSLAANWIQENYKARKTEFLVAWLSLDDFDNNPEHFLRYMLSAFQMLNTEKQDSFQKLIEQIAVMPPNAILNGFINELASSGHQVVFVLDDYHVITNPGIHSALEYLVDHQPDKLHLVMLTREDPPLPISRMRARGQLTEIRARDLRFTTDEANAFFHQSMKLELAEESISTLENRTEGWVAGLQLAGLALQNLEDPRKFIETFHGSHRYVLDYLAQEVIRQQPEDIQDFLFRTSILTRFNAASCEAVTGRADSQKILEKLEQSNMFIIPLDDERLWYRYHHLFADYLRTEVNDPIRIECFKKAANWFESQNLIAEAVRYALASLDNDFSADIIERALRRGIAWSAGDLLTLSSWLNSLPSAVFRTRPHLSLQASRFFYLTLRFQQAEELLDQTENYAKEHIATSADTERILALSAVFRGSIAAMRGEVKTAFDQIARASSHLPKEEKLAHARANFSLGQAYELNGETDKAVKTYLLSSDQALNAGVLYLAVNARSTAAMLQIIQGDLRQAAQTCREALEIAGENHIAPLGLTLCVLGSIAYEKFDLSAAEKFVLDGLELARQGGLKDDIGFGLVLLERIKSAQRCPSEALAAIEKADEIFQTYSFPRFLTLGRACMARFDLDNKNPAAALQWARSYQVERAKGKFEYLHEFEDLVMTRILLANGEIEGVSAILESLISNASAGGREQIEIEAWLLLALYNRSTGNIKGSQKQLENALRLAASQEHIKSFLVEGIDLIDLLPGLRTTCPALVDAILAKAETNNKQAKTPGQALPDPLSEQEKNVLRLILAGKSNQEIAEELVISVGTAKWHVHNILQKIGAANRAQAIVRARELGF